MRTLIVYEDSHRAYGEAMVRALKGLRPGVEVRLAHTRDLDTELIDFDPHVVVCGHRNSVDPGRRGAWIVLAEEPDEPSEICLEGRRSGVANPGLEEVLAVLDETGELLRSGRSLRGC
jgi:hypothetical protein